MLFFFSGIFFIISGEQTMIKIIKEITHSPLETALQIIINNINCIRCRSGDADWNHYVHIAVQIGNRFEAATEIGVPATAVHL